MFHCCCGKQFISRDEYSDHLEEVKHWDNDKDLMLKHFDKNMIDSIFEIFKRIWKN